MVLSINSMQTYPMSPVERQIIEVLKSRYEVFRSTYEPDESGPNSAVLSVGHITRGSYTSEILRLTTKNHSLHSRRQIKDQCEDLRHLAIAVLPFLLKYDIPAKQKPWATLGQVVDELYELAKVPAAPSISR